MDSETPYLYSDLTHEVYMSCPDGYQTQPTGNNQPNVLRLVKALYGLKQSGREWFGTLKREMENMNMTPLPSDPCVFYRQGLTVAVYVDDIMVTGEEPEIVSLKTLLMERFICKDFGLCRYPLGL